MTGDREKKSIEYKVCAFTYMMTKDWRLSCLVWHEFKANLDRKLVRVLAASVNTEVYSLYLTRSLGHYLCGSSHAQNLLSTDSSGSKSQVSDFASRKK